MRSNTLRFDIAIAVIAAIVLVIISPGLAVVGLVAVVVLVVCGLSLLFDARRVRRRRQTPSPRSRDRPRPRNARDWR